MRCCGLMGISTIGISELNDMKWEYQPGLYGTINMEFTLWLRLTVRHGKIHHAINKER